MIYEQNEMMNKEMEITEKNQTEMLKNTVTEIKNLTRGVPQQTQIGRRKNQ